MDERGIYIQLAILERRTLDECRRIYKNEQDAQTAAAECIYFDQHHELPEWATYIEQIIPVCDAQIIVHADRSKLS